MKFLRPRRPTIHSLQLPELISWTLDRKTRHLRQWVSPEYPIAISLNFFDEAPDLPSLREVEALQAHYRHQAAQNQGGLVEVSCTNIKSLPAVKTIIKFPQQPEGTMYLGSYTLPRAEYSYVLKVQAMELEPYGQRESTVAQSLIERGQLTPNAEGHYPGWAADPYDPEFRNSLLANRADAPAHDLQFPDHPLSQVRTWLTKLRWEIALDEFLPKSAPFAK